MKLSQLVFGLLVCFTGNAACGQWIVAHRGALHDAPENTLASVRLAVEQGADGVETDYYLSSDGKLVCIHDPDTERVAGKKYCQRRALAALQRSISAFGRASAGGANECPRLTKCWRTSRRERSP